MDRKNSSVCSQRVTKGLELSEDCGSLGNDNEDFDIQASNSF
jgi:hypothetical protein